MARRPDFPLATGVILSLVLHSVALLPFLVMVLQAPGAMSAMSASLNPDDFAPPQEPPAEELTAIGIDESEHSSLSWVGYEEYKKHLARLAELEQAAFDESAAAAQPQEQSTAAGGAVAPETAIAEVPERESAQPVDDAPREVLDPALLEETLLPVLREFAEAAIRVARSKDAEVPRPADAPKPEEKPRTAQPAEPAPKPAPKPAQPVDQKRADPPPEPNPADVSDKESDPTSVIEVKLAKLGQPIAREGLELKPRRPEFTTHILVTAAPGNPLVEILFKRNGRPADARILESSGDPRVDHAIGVSLYRWRAKGKALNDLGPKETMNVRLRIVLNAKKK